MRVLLAGLFALPFGSASASRLINLGLSAQKSGAECAFLGFDRKHPLWLQSQQRCLTSHRSYQSFSIYDLGISKVHRRWLTLTMKVLPLACYKGLLLRKMAAAVVDLCRQEKFDICVLYDQDLRFIKTVYSLRQNDRWKIVQQYAECQMASDYKWGLANPFFWQQRKHFKVAPFLSDGSIVISEALRNRCQRPDHPIPCKIPALVDEISFANLGIPPSTDKKLLVITYLGSGARRDCLDVVVKGVATMVEKGVPYRLSLAGLTSKRISQWKAYAETAEHSQWLTLEGRLSNEGRTKLFSDTDIFIFLRNHDQSGESAFPTRLPEFLLTGRPVICSKIGDIPSYLNEDSICFLDKNNVSSLCEILSHLQTSFDLRQTIGSNGAARAVECFDNSKYSNQLFNFFNEIISHSAVQNPNV